MIVHIEEQISLSLSLDVDVLVAAEVFGLPAPCVMNFADEVYGPAKPQPSDVDVTVRPQVQMPGDSMQLVPLGVLQHHHHSSGASQEDTQDVLHGAPTKDEDASPVVLNGGLLRCIIYLQY